MKNPLKCLIIEDEPLAIKQLESYIAQVPGFLLLNSVHDIEDPEIFRDDLLATDILFLDIQVCGGDIILLEEYVNSRPYLILISALSPREYPDFIRKRYFFTLKKPITADSFHQCIQKIIQMTHAATTI